MFGFGKRTKSEREQKLAYRATWEGILRERLNSLIDNIVDDLIMVNEFSEKEVFRLIKKSSDLKNGVDYLLIFKIDQFDTRVPDSSRGGAMIANSVHAWFFLAQSLGQADACEIFGTQLDKETVGNIYFQLGYLRDGLSINDDMQA